MSALPVLRCGLMPRGDGSHMVTIPLPLETQPYQSALVVPDALWADSAFCDACMDRWPAEDGAWALFDAILAELRSRAGVPETDFGNPKDGAA